MSNNRYDLDTQAPTPVDYADTRLLYVSTAKYGGDWYSTMHVHGCTEIFYVVGGSGQFNIEKETYPVSAGDMMVVNPNVRHTEVGRNAAPLEYIVLGIDGLEFLVAGDEEDDHYGVIDFHNEREEILHYLRCMLRELENKASGYLTVCQKLLEILLLHLMRRTDYTLTPVQPGDRAIKGCAAVRRYIESHFKENISLQQLAKMAHFNKYYMAHSFTRQYGTSPINYQIACRVAESKRLLTETDFSLNQIAGMLGFSSSSYFSQSFRRLEGTSPMEYRKHSRDALQLGHPERIQGAALPGGERHGAPVPVGTGAGS